MIRNGLNTYYAQLHETSRTYQTTMWAVPAIFFGLQAICFQGVQWEKFVQLRNAIMLFGDAVFTFCVFVQFVKIHFQAMLMHKEIDGIDAIENSERIPLYSHPKNLCIDSLREKGIRLYWYQKVIICSKLGAARVLALTMLMIIFFCLITSTMILGSKVLH